MSGKKGAWLLLAFLCVGCDTIVERAVVSREPVVGDVSCQKFSYCYTCMIGFGGKGCSFKFSGFCPGLQSANLIRTTEQRWHESGKESFAVTNVVVSKIGACR